MAGESTARKDPRAGLAPPWPRGVSGNPGGRPKQVRELEAAVLREHTEEKVLPVLERLRDIAMGKCKVVVSTREGLEAVDFTPSAQVQAGVAYLNRVMGPAREIEAPQEHGGSGSTEEAALRLIDKLMQRPELAEKVKLRVLDGGKSGDAP